jgi:hypothetical protein
MRKPRRVKAEIVPASGAHPVPRHPKQNLQATLERMVRERVDEIMAQRDSQLFEPDFRPRSLTAGIFQRQTVFDRKKWSLYYSQWGCRRCDRKNVPHSSLGYCTKCRLIILQRLVQIKRAWDREHSIQSVEVSHDSQFAKRILGSLPTEPEEGEQ